MSVINRMLNDLHQRADPAALHGHPHALAQGTSAQSDTFAGTPAQAPGAAQAGPVMSYASARLSPRHSGATRTWLRLGAAAAVAASLPLVWAATRPVKSDAVTVPMTAPSTVTVTAQSQAPAQIQTPAPTPAPAPPAATVPLRNDSVWVASFSPSTSFAAPDLWAAPAMKVQGSANGAAAAATATATATAAAARTATAAPLTAPLVAAVSLPAATASLAPANPTALLKPEVLIERRPAAARDDLARAGDAMAVGRTSEAVTLLRKVIQVEPGNERAHLALLALLAERGRDDIWRSALLESAAALPQRFGVAAAQGLAESGRLEESLGVLQQLPEAARDVRFFSAQGATLQQLNQHAGAVAAFDAALKLAAGTSATLPSLLVAQAVSMQAVGRRVEARQNFERVQNMSEVAADVREFAVRELSAARR